MGNSNRGQPNQQGDSSAVVAPTLLAGEVVAPQKPIVETRNLETCQAYIDLCESMMLATIDRAKVVEIHAAFKAFYAQKFSFMINDEETTLRYRPSVTGSHEDMQAVVNPLWTGIKNFTIKCGKPIAIGSDGATFISTFTCDHVFTDATSAEIEGTNAQGFEIIQTLTFDADGKISNQLQEFDLDWIEACQKKVRASRNLAAVKGLIDVTNELIPGGAIDDAKVAELRVRLAGFFMDPCTVKINESGPTITGSVGEVSAFMGSIYMGQKVNKFVVGSVEMGSDDCTCTFTRYSDHVFTDASGTEVEGTAMKDFRVAHTITFDADGKIELWEQELDLDWLDVCQHKVRAADRSP